MPFPAEPKIAVIGLGYVGLPLATAFGQHFDCVGFDINSARVAQLQQGRDSTQEVSADELAQAKQLTLSDNPDSLEGCDIYIVTVPTPIDDSKRPDLSPLKAACELIGRCIQPHGIAIFESTVYPGCTEEVCLPIIEQISGLQYNRDFFAGYSPERINPGDKTRKLTNITKITSGSKAAAADYIDQLYRRIITAGTFKASSIRVAEAAKAIENTQRDVNIALINELALMFHQLGIDSQEVLDAAATKWNFLPFKPGLVGGHCIGVDPYYLVHRSKQAGYYPEIISAARRINDSIGRVIASRVMRLMTQKRIHIVDSRILIMGAAFKENCPDLRNTRVVDIINELQSCNAQVDIYDPWVDPEQASSELGIALCQQPQPSHYDALIVAVAHQQFIEMGIDAIKALAKRKSVLFDVKYLFAADQVDGRL